MGKEKQNLKHLTLTCSVLFWRMEYYPTLSIARAELLAAHLWLECSVFTEQSYYIRLLASCGKLCPFFWSKVTCGENNVGNTQPLRLPFFLQQSPTYLTLRATSWGLTINVSPHRPVKAVWSLRAAALSPPSLPQLHVPTPHLSNRIPFPGIVKL